MRNVLCIIIILAAIPCCARIITVANNVPADFNNIQAAIIDANDGDTVEIQPGTYTGPPNTDIDFLGKPITLRSKNPKDPNTVAQTIIDCNNTAGAFIFQTNEDQNSILDGLTITAGTPGITITDSAPTIRNCIMTDNPNHAIDCRGAASLTITRCLFTNNSASLGGAIYSWETTVTITNSTFTNNFSTVNSAGAIRADQSLLTINDCTFQNNSSHTAGGAINAADCELSINGSRFIGNSAFHGRSWWLGGALSLYASTAAITNTLFAGNTAQLGGAISGCSGDLTLNNCTFAQNYAIEGRTMADLPYYCASNRLIFHIKDSIIWDGPDSIAVTQLEESLITFSDYPGSWQGYANINADPCFANLGLWVDANDPNIAVEPNDPNAVYIPGDFHLKSQAGRYDPATQAWLKDDATSPCIDAADPNSSLGQEPFPNGGRINMGLYGGTPQATKSYFGKPPCETIVAGDINGDCIVNSTDFALMSAYWQGQYYKSYPVPAKDPNPRDGEEYVSINTYLGWQAHCYPPYLPRPRWEPQEIDPTSPCAASHDVYFGTDYTALRNADRNSPQYKGNQPAEESRYNGYLLDELDANTTYYWRIDQIGANGAMTIGYVWSFTTGENTKLPPISGINPD